MFGCDSDKPASTSNILLSLYNMSRKRIKEKSLEIGILS